jgi:hypothetical protein
MNRERLTVLTVFALYFAWQGIALWFSTPEESGDTWRYFELPLSEPINTGFTTPLFFQAINDHRLITLGMVMVSAITWSLLAIAVFRAVPRRVPAAVLAVATHLCGVGGRWPGAGASSTANVTVSPARSTPASGKFD